MIGHHVTCTVWHVRVGWYAKPPEGAAEGTKGIWEMHESQIVTASDDGSDIFECARRKYFKTPEEARACEFSIVHLGRVGQAEGMALGHQEKVWS